MSKPVVVAFNSDITDLTRGMDKAEAAMDSAADTAVQAGRRIDSAMDGVAESSDRVASKGAQAAGALNGLGDLIGGKTGTAMQAGGIAFQAFADAGDLVNVALESKIVRTVKDIAVTKAQQAATLAKLAADKAVMAASKTWTAIQWALNAALAANPIGALVLLIAGLIAAVVLAYKRSDTFREIVDKAFSKIMAAGKALWSVLSGVLSKVAAAVGSVIGAVGNLRAQVTKVFSDVVGFIAGIPGKILALAGKFKDAGAGLMKSIIEGIQGAAGFIGNIAGNIWEGVKKLINGAIGKLNDALEFKIPIPGAPDIHVNPPDIPYLASGGIVTRPTVAVIGEAGPEAVVPLNRFGFGTRVEVNVNVAPTADRASIGREIQRALDSYYRLGGRAAVA